jgi:histone deacetylase 11
MSKLPIIYHSGYNIDLDELFGSSLLMMVVPVTIDTQRYQKIVDYLRVRHIDPQRFSAPTPVSRQDLLLVHSDDYLKQLQQQHEILAHIFELPCLPTISSYVINDIILKSQLLATGGTVLGCQLAFEYGWAINLSGGYHHAKSTNGGGFCIYSDIGIAVKKLCQQRKSRVLIVDLDAHQGNGYAEIFLNEPSVIIFDVYHQAKYPCMFEDDIHLRRRINYNYPITSETDDSTYLQILTTHLHDAIREACPDLIIYNAGYDILRGDPFGGLEISEKTVIYRDQYLFETATLFQKPILMLVSGGYVLDIDQIIGQSINNLIHLKTRSSQKCEVL